MIESHITGESQFIDDIPLLENEVFVSYVGSPVASGKLKKINDQQAKKVNGVLAILTAKDVQHNYWGTIVQDQPLLVDEHIGYKDEPICIIAALTSQALDKAKKLIQFEIEPVEPVLSLQEAINKKNFLHQPGPFKCGDVDQAFKNAANILSGEFKIGGQEHFYLESQAAIAYIEDGQFVKVISSSQHPTETQHLVAEALGLPYHHVVCEVKRMGGAFGGKESQAAPFAAMAALVAYKLKRPARIILSKDDDMKVTGKRHPFHNFYQVAFDNEGVITGLKIQYYADGGAYTDLSPSIIDRTLFHSDGCYFIENVFLQAWVCKTNTHSNTAFRGFGGPQGNLTIENIIEQIAQYLKVDAKSIREKNLYQKNTKNRMHYGQILQDNSLPEIFQKLLITSEYEKRQKEITEFNLQSKTHFKGIAISGCKFGISFTARFLNQGNALVNIHRDGKIQVSTGATEMGQGVYLKIQKIVAECFGISFDDVKVMATSTEKNANTSPTAASSGADLNAAAALNACEKIKNRLKQLAWILTHSDIKSNQEIEVSDQLDQPSYSNSNKIEFKDHKVICENKFILWKDLVQKAYLNRISISDYGFHKTTGLAFNRQKAWGDAFKYFTPGFAVSEVMIDRFTAEVKILRSDILMELGKSIHRQIDLGQIAGGFIQGVGWVTTEKLVYSPNGSLLSHSPTTYKIPNIQDIPRIFNYDFIENNLNEKFNVKGSKAVGEPPLLLGASVFLAIKNAIYNLKQQPAYINSPATSEEVLMEMCRHEN